MEQFPNILAIATAAVPPEYFYLPFDGGDGVYRERVYYRKEARDSDFAPVPIERNSKWHVIVRRRPEVDE
ncbi:hypothetical protein [Mesorhizobium carmichaelinearum]|uniref:hypothetical protein n=1 Tax=Mesorhizobium carmichaelinearum TaxID=1208188 RepID=UPI000BA3E950|nr:hypothetical protein [Mesorhizobium carmichaelinearum]